jgi:hypothetical protein
MTLPQLLAACCKKRPCKSAWATSGNVDLLEEFVQFDLGVDLGSPD